MHKNKTKRFCVVFQTKKESFLSYISDPTKIIFYSLLFFLVIFSSCATGDNKNKRERNTLKKNFFKWWEG